LTADPVNKITNMVYILESAENPDLVRTMVQAGGAIVSDNPARCAYCKRIECNDSTCEFQGNIPYSPDGLAGESLLIRDSIGPPYKRYSDAKAALKAGQTVLRLYSHSRCENTDLLSDPATVSEPPAGVPIFQCSNIPNRQIYGHKMCLPCAMCWQTKLKIAISEFSSTFDYYILEQRVHTARFSFVGAPLICPKLPSVSYALAGLTGPYREVARLIALHDLYDTLAERDRSSIDRFGRNFVPDFSLSSRVEKYYISSKPEAPADVIEVPGLGHNSLFVKNSTNAWTRGGTGAPLTLEAPYATARLLSGYATGFATWFLDTLIRMATFRFFYTNAELTHVAPGYRLLYDCVGTTMVPVTPESILASPISRPLTKAEAYLLQLPGVRVTGDKLLPPFLRSSLFFYDSVQASQKYEILCIGSLVPDSPEYKLRIIDSISRQGRDLQWYHDMHPSTLSTKTRSVELNISLNSAFQDCYVFSPRRAMLYRLSLMRACESF